MKQVKHGCSLLCPPVSYNAVMYSVLLMSSRRNEFHGDLLNAVSFYRFSLIVLIALGVRSVAEVVSGVSGTGNCIVTRQGQCKQSWNAVHTINNRILYMSAQTCFYIQFQAQENCSVFSYYISHYSSILLQHLRFIFLFLSHHFPFSPHLLQLLFLLIR